MFLGRYQQGQEVPLYLFTVDDPDRVPRAFAYSATGRAGKGVLVPLSPGQRTGYFQGRIYLDESFPPGPYTVICNWQVSGDQRGTTLSFTVSGGGDPSGQVLSLFDYRQPQAVFLVQQRSSGVVMRGKNPEV